MSLLMLLIGGGLFFGGFFLALAYGSGLTLLFSIGGAILFILAGPQRRRENEVRYRRDMMPGISRTDSSRGDAK